MNRSVGFGGGGVRGEDRGDVGRTSPASPLWNGYLTKIEQSTTSPLRWREEVVGSIRYAIAVLHWGEFEN